MEQYKESLLVISARQLEFSNSTNVSNVKSNNRYSSNFETAGSHCLLIISNPGNHLPSASLSSSNPNKLQSVAFKFKTNAPERYAVRPIFGLLKPGESQQVLFRCDSDSIKQYDDMFMLQMALLDSNGDANQNNDISKFVSSQFYIPDNDVI